MGDTGSFTLRCFAPNASICQHIPVESDREDVRDWVLSVCMDAKIDQALPPEKEAAGTLYLSLIHI